MKFMQTIIAFSFIYLFVGVILVAMILGAWFSTFTPNMPRQQMAEIVIGSRDTAGAPFSYKATNSNNALKSMITRGTPQNVGATSSEVLAARSEVLFATYTDATLSDALVPIGFSHMYRLDKVVDASGNIVYERPSTWVDALAMFFMNKNISQDKKDTMFIATDREQSYTIIASTKGLEVIQQ